VDERDFLKALNVQSRIEAVSDPASLSRVVELFQRTTQFNTTGRTYSVGELARLAETGGGVFAMHVSDRYGDHGLSGAAVLEAGVITGFAMSCRVIGLKVERDLLAALAAQASAHGTQLRGQILPTDRNTPVRNLYRDAGFAEAADGWWTLPLDAPATVDPREG